MIFNRGRTRGTDAWGRVFVLLIILFVGLYFIDRFIGLDGIFQQVENTNTPVPSLTPTSPLVFATAEEYVFAAPTEVPVTSTPQPTPTQTPEPYFPMELIRIADEDVVERSEPLSAIALCEEPYKTSLYASYDPLTHHFRMLTDSIPYLTQPADPFVLALHDGLLQRDLPVDFLDEFPFPLEWRYDMQYAILAVSDSQDAIVVHRWTSENEILYWLSRGSETLVELLRLPNGLEESYTDPSNAWLFLRLLNEDEVSDLYAIDLTTGGIVPMTRFQSGDAFGGSLSWDGIYYAYWTSEGVWVIKLDGSYGVLAFPGAEQPAWSPDGEHLILIRNDRLEIGSMALVDTTGGNLTALPVQGRQPVWSPDGSTIVYWQSDGADCTLNFWDVTDGVNYEVFRTQNKICQSSEVVRWSPTGDSLITSLPSTGDSGEASGDLICQLETRTCEYLRYTQGNYPCRGSEWSEYTFPYVWNFDTSAEGWYRIQQLDTLSIENGILKTLSYGMTPVLNSPKNLSINADSYPFIEITMQVSGGTQAEINFATVDDPTVNSERLFSFDIIPDGEMHRYVLDLRDYSKWDGTVKYLRFRPVNESLVEIQIQSIRLLATLEEAD